MLWREHQSEEPLTYGTVARAFAATERDPYVGPDMKLPPSAKIGIAEWLRDNIGLVDWSDAKSHSGALDELDERSRKLTEARAAKASNDPKVPWSW
jgi:hypothetical protein